MSRLPIDRLWQISGRLPKGVGQEASSKARHTASEWMPLEELGKAERAEADRGVIAAKDMA